MDSIDLHGLSPSAAVAQVAREIRQRTTHGQRGKLMIVHGYGSSGRGGVLRDHVRRWLTEQGIDFLRGELAGRNPGVTTVLLDSAGRTASPAAVPPAAADDLPAAILALCAVPQPMDKLAGKLRRHGDVVVRHAIDRLVKSGALRVVQKGRLKAYVAAEE